MEQKKVDGTQRLDVHRFPTNTRNQVQSEHPANITQAKVHGEVHCSNGNETDGTGFRASCKRTRLSTVGDQAFPVAAARVWNSLPRHVTSAPSLSVYCSRLKSHLFKQSFPWPLLLSCLHSDSIISDTLIVLVRLFCMGRSVATCTGTNPIQDCRADIQSPPWWRTRYLGPFTSTADVPGRRALRSDGTNRQVVPPVRLSTVGRRAFPVAAAQIA